MRMSTRAPNVAAAASSWERQAIDRRGHDARSSFLDPESRFVSSWLRGDIPFMLKIRDATDSQYDLMSRGECMIRLSPPGHGRLEFANALEIWVGGGEYNVAYALARLSMRTGFLSRLVDNP